MGGQLETIQEFSPRSTLQEGIIHLNPKLHALQKKKKPFASTDSLFS